MTQRYYHLQTFGLNHNFLGFTLYNIYRTKWRNNQFVGGTCVHTEKQSMQRWIQCYMKSSKKEYCVCHVALLSFMFLAHHFKKPFSQPRTNCMHVNHYLGALVRSAFLASPLWFTFTGCDSGGYIHVFARVL